MSTVADGAGVFCAAETLPSAATVKVIVTALSASELQFLDFN